MQMDDPFHSFQSKVEDWHWWYRTRRAILDSLVGKLGLDPERATLLDIGCGTGGASLVLRKYGRPVALDASMSSFAEAPERPYAHRVVGSAEQLPFAEDSFDAVCALDVIEHLDDDIGAIREMRRVLKPGGAAIIFVPAFQILWGWNDTQALHRRRYTERTLRRALEAGGFQIETIGYFNLLLFLPLLAARLLERVLPDPVHQLEFQESPTLVNELLARTFQLELPLLRRAPLPLGTSAYCLARI